MQVQMQVYKESNISVCVMIILFVYSSLKKLTCKIKWNTFYLDNPHMCVIAIAAMA